jgi:hypothetical protein
MDDAEPRIPFMGAVPEAWGSLSRSAAAEGLSVWRERS